MPARRTHTLFSRKCSARFLTSSPGRRWGRLSPDSPPTPAIKGWGFNCAGRSACRRYFRRLRPRLLLAGSLCEFVEGALMPDIAIQLCGTLV